MKHKQSVDNVEVGLEVSDVNPGHVILTMSSGNIHFTAEMDPIHWQAFMEAAATVGMQAFQELAAVSLAEARARKDCN